jgi:hypothetical protein
MPWKLTHLLPLYHQTSGTWLQTHQNIPRRALSEVPEQESIPRTGFGRTVKKKVASLAPSPSLCWKDFRGVHEAWGRHPLHLRENQKPDSLERNFESTQEARKSKFEEFYLSMIKDNYGDPYFQVKNYLYKEEIKILTDQDIFDDLTRSMERQVKEIRLQFISVDKKS